jgi:hypothetical protein
MGVSGQLHSPAALSPTERAPGTLWIWGWVGPREGLDAVVKKKSPPLPGLGPLITQPIAQRYTTELSRLILPRLVSDWLWAGRSDDRGSIPGGAWELLGPTQPLIQRLPGALPVRVKRLGREADHSLPPSAEEKMRGAIPPHPRYVFMAWCLVKHRDNFTFTLPLLQNI